MIAARIVRCGVAMLLFAALSHPSLLLAQSADDGAEPSWFDTAWPGATLGVGGFVAGGLIGGTVASCSGDEYCTVAYAFFGAAALGTLGLATGVHLGNDRRGSYLLDLATAAGLWGVTMVLLEVADYKEPWAAIGFAVLPIGQLVATVAVERATGAPPSDRALDIGIGPSTDGGFMLAGRLHVP